MSQCTHMNNLVEAKPNSEGCKKCLEMGDEWVNLRVCLTCGHVGCCDDSKNKHATAHFDETAHPVMQSLKPGESWRWCFVDEEMMD